MTYIAVGVGKVNTSIQFKVPRENILVMMTPQDIIQIFHVIVVNIQEYFPEVPWIEWMC
jgi:hypothetical protein